MLALPRVSLGIKFEDLAIDELMDLILLISDAAGKVSVGMTHMRFTVFGDDMTGADESMHKENVAAVAVTGDMECEFGIGFDRGALEVKIIDDLGDCPLVPDDGITTQDDRISFFNCDVTMSPESHPCKTGCFFTLAPRCENQDLVIR